MRAAQKINAQWIDAVNADMKIVDGAGDVGVLFSSMLAAWQADELECERLSIMQAGDEIAELVITEDGLEWLAHRPR